MVTIVEAEGSVKLAQQQLEEEKRKVAQYKAQALSLATPNRSLAFQQEVIAKGQIQQGRIEQTIKQRQAFKQQAIAEANKVEQDLNLYQKNVLNPYVQQIGQAKQQQAAAEAEAKAYSDVIKHYERGSLWAVAGFGSGREQEIAKELLKEGYGQTQLAYNQRAEALRTMNELKAQGLVPKYTPEGKLAGFEDYKLGMSYELSQFPTLRPEALSSLQKQGVLKVEQTPSQQISMVQPTLAEQKVSMSLIPSLREEFNYNEKTKPAVVAIQEQALALRLKTDKTTSEKVQQTLGGITLGGIDLGMGLKTLFTTNPKETIKAIPQIPKATIESAKERVSLFRTQPYEAIGRTTFDIIGFKGIGKSIKGLEKGTEEATILGAKVTGKFKAIEGNKIKLISEEGKALDIEIVNKIPTKSFKEQVSLAGKETTLVSGSKDLFGLVTKRSVEINKPIPVTEGFKGLSKSSEESLKLLKEGKLSIAEISRLETQVVKETGSKGLLESSFFADPSGKLRPSRLGIVEEAKEAGLRDILSGNVSFKKVKPQGIIFEKETIESFPRGFRGIQKKLTSNQALTKTEQSKLLAFQFKQSGKFKPIGFLTREAEATLAPGEVIFRKRTMGITKIKGKKVTLISAGIKQKESLTKGTQELLSKKVLTTEERTRLSKRLSKETGISYRESNKLYLSPYQLSGKATSTLSYNLKSSKVLSSSSKNLSKLSKVSSSLSKYKPSGTSKIEYKYKPSTYKTNLSSYKPYAPKRYGYQTYAPPKTGKLPYILPRYKEQSSPPIRIKQRTDNILKEKKSIFKRKTYKAGYTPSFTAVSLGIKARRKPIGFGGKNTYFAGIRPIIE